MEHNGEDWSKAVEEGVAAFSRQVKESSQQLASAADRFAAEAGRVLQEATRRSEEAARRSEEASQGASSASAEARQSLEAVRHALSEAAEQVKGEARAYFEDASQKAQDAIHASIAQTAASLQERALSAAQQAEQFAASTRDHADQAARSAEEARNAASQPAVSPQNVAMVEAAAETARNVMAEVGSLRAAVAAAEDAAREARQMAAEANALAIEKPSHIAPEPVVSAGAEEVLERLEADYSLLTKLVQELHARIATLSTQTAPVYEFQPPAAAPQIEASPEAIEEVAYGAEDADVPVNAQEWQPEAREAQVSWSEPHYSTPDVPAAFVEDDNLEEVSAPKPEVTSFRAAEVEPEPVTAGAGPTIAGRVLVSISPVPDFDRLLSLDGALGRMPGIGNVTLADYAREEVTFRIEVDSPTSVEDFRSRLSQSAGAQIEVVASGDEALMLRLAS